MYNPVEERVSDGVHLDHAMGHRKRIKHFHEPGDVHELTFSCYRRMPLLTNDDWRGWFCEAVDRACERHQILLLAYVLMPEHVHALVIPRRGRESLPKWLSHVKHPVAVRVKKVLQTTGSRLLETLTVQQRPGVMTFRFWQEGSGYDRNLTGARTIVAATNYIHENPIRRGLCRRAVDWRWSSARRLYDIVPLDSELPRLSRFDPDALLVE